VLLSSILVNSNRKILKNGEEDLKMIKHTFEEEPGQIIMFNEDHEQIGEITYQDAGDGVMIIDHTGVDNAYRGHGLAAELVKQAVEVALRDNKKIVPLCPYAHKEFVRHEEYKKCLYTDD
jgi:uncharacterized protein